MPRSPGRPPQDASFDARQALVEAGREEFVARGFHGASIRQIAQRAKVNPALVAYHFGDKAGLFKTVISDAMDPLYEQMTDLDLPADDNALGRFLEVVTGFLFANPWLPQLMLRDVLAPGGEFAEYFSERLARRNRALIERIVVAGQRGGTIRTDLAPPAAALTIISQLMFPFLAWPIASRVFELERTEELRHQWIERCKQLLAP